MDEQLIKSGNLPLRRRSLLPGTGFFYPDSLDEDRSEERAREAIEGAEAVVVTDSDADGLGCIALVREMYDAALDVDPFLEEIENRLSEADQSDDEEDEDDEDQPESSVALLAAGPHSLTESLEYVADYAETGVDVFICDIAPDEYEPIAESVETIRKRSDRVSWYDHHQWPEAVAESVGEAGVDLVVGDSDEECSTDVALRSLDYEFDERFTDLAEVTRDHDLWLNEDPRSKDLADYAYWTSAEEYAAVVGAYGADLPESVEDYIAHRRVEKEQLIELAVDRAAYKSIGPWTVGVTYGRCSQNEVADGLQEAGADAAVIVKPSGSASIRGSETFEQAHLVARQVEGGGHPKAAGCKPDIYDDMMDYAYHWTTEGETTKRVILAAFRRVAEDVAAEDEAEQDEPTAE
ncbi:oligoribonuclease NrnB/cAMP/cGMP phosphodiesterase (DHH superfamily) [Halohasta litchfieldiae]|jgi:oligoribonuclease NrnB/cAMP/cGMP phosphodiesterase (DHH superfamily)|uniref:Oligoribonuclease NrnB or cAMP/cGMP phosphodiesterase, DHH superfamily n=1 Tax=Halohasta litchfieldiae TaxID=1073996 RepID=A0A1H6TNL4_9EURY|nr:phosphohydrolase [Halohasta litchfieldiae]ATW88861.1 oligoribonuclease NrnB/cAMP/cGMP phosphodiesterase (DHH superfamily) [Halohasta litchfieldiae]SEI79764.1 Oligoribonuclease NrnB or cAMP/cGMP phosphodiesterase, DHH superfamily [Halohasta litchfieldiae]